MTALYPLATRYFPVVSKTKRSAALGGIAGLTDMPFQKLPNVHAAVAVSGMGVPVQQDVVLEGLVERHKIRGGVDVPVEHEAGIVLVSRQPFGVAQPEPNCNQHADDGNEPSDSHREAEKIRPGAMQTMADMASTVRSVRRVEIVRRRRARGFGRVVIYRQCDAACFLLVMVVRLHNTV